MRSPPISSNSISMNHYAHGYVLMPILHCLMQGGVLSLIKERYHVALTELTDSISASPGYLRIALRVAEAVGLVKCDEAIVRWEAPTSSMLDIELSALDPALFTLYGIDPVDYLARTPVGHWSGALTQIEQRWSGLSIDWLREFADGMVVIPLLTGLRQLDLATDPAASEVDISAISPVAAVEVYRLFDLLGWADGLHQNKLQLTVIGRWIYRNALNYALGLSYRKLLHRVRDLVFGDPQGVFDQIDGFEGHVDRALNVLASGSMHKTYFKTIADTVVRLFHQEHLHEQPAYIIDTGCGDGSLLTELYQRIRQDSPRGQALASHPVTMIGVDYNQAALAVTQQRLTANAIPHLTLRGDIGDPAMIRSALADRGVDLTRPLLHVRSFLDHDRSYNAPAMTQDGPLLVPGGLHATREGAVLPARDVQDSLIDHLARWRRALGKHDELLVLEVHAIEPRRAFETKQHDISLHFEPLQALTGQLLVSAKAFFYATAVARLHTLELIRFPEQQALTRISFQRMRPVGHQIRFATVADTPVLANLAATWLRLPLTQATELVERRLRDYPHGQFVVQSGDDRDTIHAAAYVNRSNTTPCALALDEAIDLPSGQALRIVDVHVTPDQAEQWRPILLEFLVQWMLLDESYGCLVFQTDPWPTSTAPAQQLIERIQANDPSVPRLTSHAPRLLGVLGADEDSSRARLLLAIERQPSLIAPAVAANNLTMIEARELLQEAIKMIAPTSHTHLSQVTSLLDLGLDSLEIARLSRYLNQHLNMKISVADVFRHSQIHRLVELLVERTGNERIASAAVCEASEDARYPLSLSQEPMWIWFEKIGETSAYNVPRIDHFTGALDVNALSFALRHIMSRHQILRTRYATVDGCAQQMVMPLDKCHVPLRIIRPEQQDGESLRRLIETEINRPLDLTEGKTFRVLILERDGHEWVMVITMHHMVTDGSSIPIFWHELTESYAAALQHRSPQLPSLNNGQYHDWGKWQRTRFERGEMDEALEYWRKALVVPLPVLELPVDQSHPAQQSFSGHRVPFELSAPVTAALNALVRSTGVTLFAAITASWAVFLTRMSGQDEIIIGTPWANREHEMAESLIGCFVNILPLRIRVDVDQSFRGLTSRVRDITLTAIEHAEIPFHKIVEKLRIGAPAGRLPVYQTMVALEQEQGWIRGDSLAGTVRVDAKQALSGIRDTSKFELSLSIRERSGADGQAVLQGELVYCTDLYESQTMDRLRDRYLHMLTALTAAPDTPLDAIDLVSPTERVHLLSIGAGPTRAWPSQAGLLDLIDVHAEARPDAVALEWEDVTLSYAELRRRKLAMAAHFAMWLRQEKATLDACARQPWQHTTCFIGAIEDFIRTQPDVVVLVHNESTLTYRAFGQAVDTLSAHLLALGAKTVAACLPPGKDSLIVPLATLSSGMRTLLFDADATAAFLTMLEQESFDVVIAPANLLMAYGVLNSPAQPGRLATLALSESPNAALSPGLLHLDSVLENPALTQNRASLPPRPNDASVTFFTSGSTGVPKGVEHTLSSLHAAVSGFSLTLHGEHADPSRTIFLNRIPHFGGFMTAYAVLASGGTLFAQKSFDAKALIEAIRAYHPTHLVLFTSWLSALCAHGDYFPALLDSLRVVVGGEPMSPRLLRHLCNDSSVDLIGTFGISECGPLFVKRYRSDAQIDLGDPAPGVAFKLMPCEPLAGASAVGELWIQSPAMFTGYRGDPQRTADCFTEAGWFRTGDMVTVNNGNCLALRGRAGDEIKHGLFVQDLEAALLDDPSVHEVCIGWDGEAGRLVHLRVLVVPAAGVGTSRVNAWEQRLHSLCAPGVASVLIEPVDCLPRHAGGKLARPRVTARANTISKSAASAKARPRAIMFPGQGVQFIGMLDAYTDRSECVSLLELAEDLTCMPLRSIYAHGPASLLARTDVSQIGIFLASLFEWRTALQNHSGLLDACEAMFGLSLGEYTALVAAGALNDTDAIRLLHIRGRAMQYAASQSDQRMISIRELPRGIAMELLSTVPIDTPVYLATDLAEQHIVVAGSGSGCALVMERARKRGAICTALAVAGAFHTPYMESAAMELSQALQTCPFSPPHVPILSNADAQFTTSPDTMLANLVKHLAHPVQLRKSLLRLKRSGLHQCDIHTCGPGQALQVILSEAWDESVRLLSYE
ncbi:condensation domain-containing protein [Dyella flagellata]|uniref:Carrier domain-containing protein n=1 Tax=Dyella flagellata TaxID=1867833 RepID=A0ABQ5X6A3_9GAMM|nr:condensation domain-containing protein [Dyella flagellata]GLQ86641.1 hypothetical protein GCM10007898_02070 [Dyella flagellata]